MNIQSLPIDGMRMEPGTDIHLTRDWFELLASTALPADTEVSYWSISSPDSTDKVHLPLMRHATDRSELRALSNFYTPIFGAVGVGEFDESALTEVFRHIRRSHTPSTTRLILAPLAVDGTLYTSVLRALQKGGWLADSFFCFGNWYTRDDLSSFTTYFGRRPAALRNTIVRARRKLERRNDFELRIHTEADTELERAISDFETVYKKRWQRCEPYPAFIPGLCRIAAARGWLRLGVMHLDNLPVAAQLWLVAGGKAHIVKLPYDPAYGNLSVGSVLTAHLMQQVIDEDRVEEIDYLIGDDAYKRNWTPSRRERRGIVAFNPFSTRGLARAFHHFGGKAFRPFAQRERRMVSPPCQ